MKRAWIALKVGRHVYWLFLLTGEKGHDIDNWSGFGVLLGTREPR